MNLSTSIENKIFFSKYKADSKIGQGSFGKIYSSHNINTGELFALKLEKRNRGNSLLEIETYFLCYLKGEGIPYIKSYGFSGEYNVLVMELLGKSLETLFKENKSKFSLKTVCMLAEQMITRLEHIHKKYILHRDIKPDNFVLGLGKKSHIVYLIDFGLSKKYRSFKGNYEHIKYSENKKLIGTARYASINALKGCEQGRRDDLESLGYVLMYFLRGNLPWQGLKLYNGDNRYKKIYEVKKETSAEVLCAGYPRQFYEFVRYARNLSFEQEPDYDFLKGLIYQVMNRYEYHFDFLFDWGLNKEKNKINSYKKKDNDNDNGISYKKTNENNILNNINYKEKKETFADKNNNLKANKKQTITNINKKNNCIKEKKINKMRRYKLNNTCINIHKSRKAEVNNNKKDFKKKGENKYINPIKNKKEILRNSERLSKNKNLFKNNDNIIFDKLLNIEPNIQDNFFYNKSQDMNLRVNHYKFISELNSTSKKEKGKKFLRKKDMTPINYNSITYEENKSNQCFIF